MRLLAFFATVVLVLALTPSPTTARTKQLIPLSDGAGFHHAMTEPRTAIRVEDENNDAAAVALAYWNVAAGWPLLVFSEDPEIEFYTRDEAISAGYCDVGTCCYACAWWTSPPPYAGCKVILPNDAGYMSAAHEVGHCLGWDSRAHKGNGVIGGHELHLAYERRGLTVAGYRASSVMVCEPVCR